MNELMQALYTRFIAFPLERMSGRTSRPFYRHPPAARGEAGEQCSPLHPVLV